MNYFLTCIALLIFGIANAQNTMRIAQFQWNSELLHPALMSSEAELSLGLFYRKQWTTFPGAPISQGFHGAYAFTENHVGGCVYYADRIGIYQQNTMYLRYAFRLPLSKTSFFALALNAGFKNNKVMYADVNTIQSNDIAFNQNTNFWSPNTGFSIAYVQPEFSAAISVNELFQNNAPMKMDFSPQNMHLYAYLNYTLNAGEQMEWKFGLQGKMAANAPIHFQTHVQVLFSEKILAGIGFAADKSLTLQTGCMIGSSLRIGYAYDLYFGGMHGQQNGSHELFLGAGFPFYKNAFAKRKYLRKNGDWKKF